MLNLASASDLSVNTGTYYGNGYTNSYSRNSLYSNKVPSAAAINRVSRDIAQGYSQNLEIIDLYLQQGKINKALAMYESLVEEVKISAGDYGYDFTDSQIATIADKAFGNVTGVSLSNSINNESHSPFVTGLAEGLPIIGLFVNGNSNAEAIDKISGRKTDFIDKAAETAGAILTNAASYAAIGGVFSGGALAIPGAILGAAVGIGKCLFKGN